MKGSRLLLTLLLLLFVLCSEAAEKNYTLFDGGHSDYCIVLPSSPSPSESYAAEELQLWLNKIGNVVIPIKRNREARKGKRIIIGDRAAKSFLSLSPPNYETDSFEYLSVDGDIVICGGTRGIIYGMYAFLKNEFGCRWYTKDVSKIPTCSKYTFTSFHINESPAFDFRQVFYFEARDYSWKLRNGINQINAYPPSIPRDITGGSYVFCGSHSFNVFVSPERYSVSHPEYFSLVNGRRVAERAQICLSNPDVLKLCTEGILQQIESYPDYYAYSLSQNDCYKPCECKNCKALLDKYGTQSGVLIWFVNKVAEEVERKYPGKYISTLAYQYTKQAPKNIKPRDNVIIELCNIDDCAIHDWNSCAENEDFLQSLLGWTSISNNVYVFDYVSNYIEYFLPVPNFHVFQSRLKLCRDVGCRGVREYGVNLVPDGEFAALKNYVLAQLLWNPDENVDSLVNDFIDYCYGSSARYVRAYYDLLQSQVNTKIHMHNDAGYNHEMYSDELVRQMIALLNKAAKVSDNIETRNRVEALQLSSAYLSCRKHPIESKKDGNYELLQRVFKRDQITRIGVGTTVEQFEQVIDRSEKDRANPTLIELLHNVFSRLFNQ